MAFFEMISANAVFHRQKKTLTLLKTIEEDKPVACQFLGNDPDIMLSAARIVLGKTVPAFIDINAACPVKKVVNNGQGAALLKKPEILFEIVKKMSEENGFNFDTVPMQSRRLNIMYELIITKRPLPKMPEPAQNQQLLFEVGLTDNR